MLKRIQMCFVIIAMFSCVSCVHMFQGWSKTDEALFAGYTALNAVDILQTRQILQDDKYTELNPIISGMSPDMATVYMLGMNVLVYEIADHLPKHRSLALGIADSIKLITVGNNFGIGVGVKF